MLKLNTNNFLCIYNGKLIEVVGKTKEEAKSKAVEYYTNMAHDTEEIKNVENTLEILNIPSMIGVLE